jgi:small subunit ribosomal protein S6
MTGTAAASATRWAREYETIYILRPNVDNDAAEKIVDRLKDVITRLGGTLTKLDNWGKRKLAYPIQKNHRGIFVYLKYVGFNDLVAEIERTLRLLDEVVRFQTVLIAEDIDPASIAVDPDEVQYLHVDEEEEESEDAELERARSLGMAPRVSREASRDSDADSDDGSDDDSDDSDDSDDEPKASSVSKQKATADDDDEASTKAASDDEEG